MLIKEKMFFAEHLSLMIKGGITLSEALEILKRETKSQVFKKALDGILKKVLAGESLANSLGHYPKIFDNFFCSIVKVGEESGTLEENLKYLNSKLQQEFEMKNKIRGALIYPGLVVTMALAIAFFVSLFILPRIMKLLHLLEIELPLTTRILIIIATFFQKYWLPAIIVIVLIVILFKILLSLKSVRFYFDKIILSLPFFSRIFQNLNLARFTRTLHTLLKSGVPILEALDICINTLPNEVYKKNLISVKLKVEEGEKISDGLKRFPHCFSGTFSQMVVVGENTGSLEESLSYLAEFHEKEVDSTLKNLSGILEPVLLILVGIFVAFVALSIITPLYQFTSQLKFR